MVLFFLLPDDLHNDHSGQAFRTVERDTANHFSP